MCFRQKKDFAGNSEFFEIETRKKNRFSQKVKCRQDDEFTPPAA